MGVGSWTPADDALLLEMAEAKVDLADMSERLGRTVGAVDSRRRKLRETPEQRELRCAYHAAYSKRVRERLDAVKIGGEPQLIKNAELIARLAEAASLRPRDLTGAIMGDPPIGRSALDARR